MNAPLGTTPETGFLFHLPVRIARDITFSNRIFERTRRTQPRGVDIPVVREGNFFSTTQTFLGVPAAAGVRISLRVYDPWVNFGVRRPGPVLERIRVEIQDFHQRSIGSAVLVPRRELLPPGPVSGIDWLKPGFAAIYDLTSVVPTIHDHEFVHVRVTPEPAGAEYYAMVSVTDNETQAVSMITAQ